MDGRNSHGTNTERPIAKPEFPLPMIFSPAKRSEMPTRRQTASHISHERAHFYLKDFDENGRPTYGFFITTEPADRKTSNT